MGIESKKIILYTKDDQKTQAFKDLFAKLELIDNIYPKNEQEFIDSLSFEKILVILDWDSVGTRESISILSYLNDNYYVVTGSVHIFMISQQSIPGVLVEYGVAHSYSQEFDIDNIEKVLKDIFENTVIDEAISQKLSEVFITGKDQSDQEKLVKMEELYKQYSFNSDVCLSLSNLYMKEKKYDLVPKILNPLVVHEDQSLRELNLIGFAYYEQKQYQDALIKLQRVDELNHYNVQRLKALSFMYMNDKKFDLLVDIFKYLKELDPDDPELFKGEAKLRFISEPVEDVCKSLEAHFSKEQIVSMINEVAVYFIQQNQPEKYEQKILSLYYRACRYSLEDRYSLSKVCFNLALAYYKLADLVKAHYFFMIAAMLDNAYGEAISNAALTRLKLKHDQIIPVDSKDLVKSIFKFAS